MTRDPATTAHEQLLASPAGMRELRRLRGWTEPAIRKLGLGVDRGRITIPIRDQHGELLAILRYQPRIERRDEGPKMMAPPGSRRDLFPAPETLPVEEPVVLVEGESDAVSATSAGLNAVGVPGSSSWTETMAARFKDRDVIVCCDCDQPGRKLAEQAANSLLAHARSVRKLDLHPARDDGYDIGDLVREAADDPAQAGQMLRAVAADTPCHLRVEDRPPRPRLTIPDWQRALTDYLEGRDQYPAWPIPLTKLCDTADGGIRPGEVWVLAGYTSHGKSIYSDMIADSCANKGARVHLYMTEMTIVQRGLRLLARRTGIPFRTLRRRHLDEGMMRAAKREIARLDYGATVVSDWTPQQVAADIKATGTNVAIVDLLHGFYYSDERELSLYVNAFADSASSDAGGMGSGSSLVLVAHLNDVQMRDSRSPARPKPGLHSLKGASSIKQRADTVMFVWLQDDENGAATDDGEIWIAKARNGATGGQKVKLDREKLMFLALADDRDVDLGEPAKAGQGGRMRLVGGDAG